jgi:hypothetical protein
MPWWVFLLSCVILVGGNIYSWLWPFANLAASVILLVTIQGLIGLKSRMKNGYALISAIGVISMYLFAVHGFMRSPFINLANVIANPIASMVIGLLFVIVACGVAALLMYTESAVRRWIGNEGVGRGTGFSRKGLARFLLLVILVTGGFSLLFFWDYRRLDVKQDLAEMTVFEASHDFEEQVAGRYDLLSDSIAKQGKKSLLLDKDHAFSPGFLVDLDSINTKGLSELEISAWLFTTDQAGSLHLVMEIWDKPSGTRIEWQSEYIRPGTYTPNEWFLKTFHYFLRTEFRMPTYRIKVYAWKSAAGTWYVDDLKLRIKGSGIRD